MTPTVPATVAQEAGKESQSVTTIENISAVKNMEENEVTASDEKIENVAPINPFQDRKPRVELLVVDTAALIKVNSS